ncbi:pentraxin-4 [Discoglossus pictus]
MLRLLVVAALCLPNVLLEQSRILDQRKPLFERFRRLEEQFRRFQEVTLTRLQGIAENYNISYNIDSRFHHIIDQQESLTKAVNASKLSTGKDISDLKLWFKKLQKKNKKLELKISSLEETLKERNKQMTRDKKSQDAIMTNLTSAYRNQKKIVDQQVNGIIILQKGMELLQELVQRHRNKIVALEEHLQSVKQNNILPPSGLIFGHVLSQTPQNMQASIAENEPQAVTDQRQLKKLQTKHNQTKRFQEEQQLHIPLRIKKIQIKLQPGNGSTDKSLTENRNTNLQTSPWSLNVTKHDQYEEQSTNKTGIICNVDSVLVFPNSSSENFATFGKGLSETLLELSICSWIRTNSSYLGTIISYATEENDNKLVLHGRNGADYDTLHFVIGDPTFRELPVIPLLDGKWHHTCFIWSSIQGKYWFYVDRRLVSTGSRFQKGYEIPPGGSLILGQEQDTFGGGFDSSEAFVGYLAGFAMWNHALSPGEVSSIATGQSLTRGAILTLADASSLHGDVRKVKCTCLEYCL